MPSCPAAPSEPPAEARQDDEPDVRSLLSNALDHHSRRIAARGRPWLDADADSYAEALAPIVAALAARPPADTETLRRVRALADELDADAERAYQRSCGPYRDEVSDGQHRAYEDAAERLRAALDGDQ